MAKAQKKQSPVQLVGDSNEEKKDRKYTPRKKPGSGDMRVDAGALFLTFIADDGFTIGEMRVRIEDGYVLHGAGDLGGVSIDAAYNALKLFKRVPEFDGDTKDTDAIIEHYHNAMATLKHPVSFGAAVRASKDLSD